MSERRRLRARRALDPDDGRVPARLRRFRAGEWAEDTDAAFPDGFVSARRRWSSARRAWANAHGFTDAPYGTAPGSDWWAFLNLCGRPDDSYDQEVVP